ncbi:MAG: PAS domain S-box protein, partial [Opitutales bacterium]
MRTGLPSMAELFPRLGRMGAMGLAYFAASCLTLLVPLVREPISLLWLPAGIGLAILFRCGTGYWPAIWLGALAAALFRGIPWWPAAGVATGSTLGLLLFAALLRRSGFRRDFSRELDIVYYAVAAGLALLIPALLGVGVLTLSGQISREGTLDAIRTWWMGDWMGAIAFGPLFLAVTWDNLRSAGHRGWRYRYWLASLLLAALSILVPGDGFHALVVPWGFVPILVICIATIRFGPPALVAGIPSFVVLVVAGSALRHQSLPTGPRLESELQHEWLYLVGVGAIGWLLASMQIARQRATDDRIRAEKALREREQTLRAVLDNAPLGIWMLNREGRVRFVNQAFCRAMGIPEERFLAVEHYAELYDPATGQSCLASDAVALSAAGAHVSREKLRFADGQMHEVEIVKSRLVDGQGEIMGLVGISMDITERLKTEESLRLQSSALNAAANAMVITDRTGCIEWVNPAFSALTGYTAAEAIGRNPRDLVRSGRHDAEFFRDLWETILAGRIWRGLIVNRRKDGTLYTEEQTITPLTDAGGTVTRFIAIKQDVSALVAAQQALRDSEERHRMLFENNPLPMFVIDLENLGLLTVNGTALRQYGYTREEMLRCTIMDLRPEEDRARLQEYMQSRPADRRGSAGEWRHRRKDGSIIAVEI